MRNFILRSISGIVIVLLTFASILSNHNTFIVYISILTIIGFYEVVNISKCNRKWQLFWIIFFINFIISSIFIKIHFSAWWTITIFVLVWSSDTFGYIGGNLIGGKKLIPKVSPGKTWSGAISAIIGTTLIAYIINIFDHNTNFIYYAPLISIFCQGGDLLESWFKRSFGVKNSGKIIPGHGGVLDRIDGLLGVYLLMSILLLLCKS